MSNPTDKNLTAEDFASLFEIEDGEDQIIAAIGWLERTEPTEWGRSKPGRAMLEAVRNAPARLRSCLEALIQVGALSLEARDLDLVEAVSLDTWDYLYLRDRLEDLREIAPKFFDAEAISALEEFDEALDRADLWLYPLKDARLQMGVELGKSHRRWWSPKE